MFRFIRTGDRPVNETASAIDILGCFEPCEDSVKARLEQFVVSSEAAITFEFAGGDVTVERVTKNVSGR